MQVVRPSVRLSVTLRYSDHRLEFLENTFTVDKPNLSLSADPNMTDLLQREHPQILARIGVGYIGENVDFRHLNRRISETVQDRRQVAIDH